MSQPLCGGKRIYSGDKMKVGELFKESESLGTYVEEAVFCSMKWT